MNKRIIDRLNDKINNCYAALNHQIKIQKLELERGNYWCYLTRFLCFEAQKFHLPAAAAAAAAAAAV